MPAAQQLLLADVHAGRALRGHARVHGIADKQPQHKGQGERAHAVCGHPRPLRQTHGRQRQCGAEQQAGRMAAQPQGER